MLKRLSARLGPGRHLLLHHSLSKLHHRRVPLRLPAVLLDLVKNTLVDVLVDGAPHDLRHEPADDAAVEVDDVHAGLEVGGVGSHAIVALVDVLEDGVADDSAGMLTLEVEGGHRVVDFQQLLEGNVLCVFAEEGELEAEWLGLSDAVVVDEFNDDFAGQLVDARTEQKLVDRRSALRGSKVLVVIFLQAHGAVLAVLVWVEDAVSGAREEGELSFVHDAVDVGLGAVHGDGVHVDGARTCGGSGGFGVAGWGGVAVFRCHVGFSRCGWS